MLPALAPFPKGLTQAALDTLMPMHVALDAAGRVRATGPTIGGIIEAPFGAPFFDLFAIRRPEGIGDPATLRARSGERLFLRSRGAEGTFRGVAVADAEGGTLVNLSFGPGIIEAVRRYGLTEADFAATDLAIELLYVVEAKSMIMEELRTLNVRLRGAKNEAEQQARTDPLTGLRNRRAFDLALDDVISDQGAGPFGLMHVDLDFFKAVNDTLGHAAGDAVLRHVATVLTQETRTSDTVARIGGDEFMVLLPNVADRTRLFEIAERVISQLSQPIDQSGKRCQVAASVGLWSSVGAQRPLLNTEILAQLDAALYAAKRQGRGRACFAPDEYGSAWTSCR